MTDDPLYAQVETVLAGEIADGLMKEGDQLATEDGLMERFGVSRITVRRAVQQLVLRGLVEIRRGRGTFVAAAKITQELTELSGFVEDMQALGRRASARVLDMREVLADEVVARELALTKGTRVMRIERVRLADGVAVSFDETYLPLEIGRKIVKNNLKVQPIFSLLETKYNIPLVEAVYRLEAVAAGDSAAKALGVKRGSPLFRIERTSFSTGSEPVDYEQLSYRGDLVRFTTRLARKPAR